MTRRGIGHLFRLALAGVEKTAGTHQGKKYQEVRHSATLVVPLIHTAPSRQGVRRSFPAAPARHHKGVPTAARGAHRDFGLLAGRP